MIEYLDTLDSELLVWINGMHTAFLDNFMWIATGRWVWIPFYAALLWVLVRTQGWRRAMIWIVAVAAAITIADQVCATWLRPEFARYRPANLLNPISDRIHIVNGYRGGRYGFPSCHGANTFALLALLAPVVRRRALTLTILCWALLNCYTRMYLGVHYPGDILTGAAIGATAGLLVYLATSAIIKRMPITANPAHEKQSPLATITLGATIAVIAIAAGYQAIA